MREKPDAILTHTNRHDEPVRMRHGFHASESYAQSVLCVNPDMRVGSTQACLALLLVSFRLIMPTTNQTQKKSGAILSCVGQKRVYRTTKKQKREKEERCNVEWRIRKNHWSFM
jgi:hypothetical protein